MTIALDATYSTGRQLSGVGLYSYEILLGMAAAHPEVRFDFCYRPHRYFRERGSLTAAERVPALDSANPRASRLPTFFHGLNQRLPAMRMRRSGRYLPRSVRNVGWSTPLCANFARDSPSRHATPAARAVTRSSRSRRFTRRQSGIAAGGRGVAGPTWCTDGIRLLEFPSVKRESVILNVGAIQARKNIARLVEAFESVDPFVAAGPGRFVGIWQRGDSGSDRRQFGPRSDHGHRLRHY